jgi:GNAT superfamily N-acetyltransferase
MRQTLIEVLGEQRGTDLYSMEWLRARVGQHLEGDWVAEVLVVEDAQGRLLGHTIVRLEEGVGLFSTIFVERAARGQTLARQLIRAGEEWMQSHNQVEFVTYTDPANVKLQRLFLSQGYALAESHQGFVRLSRRLNRGAASAALPGNQPDECC